MKAKFTLARLKAVAAELGATVEREDVLDGRTTCYQVIAPEGKAWAVGPSIIRVEWANGHRDREIEAALGDLSRGLVQADY